MPALRVEGVGKDSASYISMFDANSSFLDFFQAGIEPLFSTIVIFIHSFGVFAPNFYFLVFSLLFSFIFLFSIIKIFNKITFPLLAFLTISTIYLSHFNILRQSIAVVIFLLCIALYKDKKYLYLFLSFLIGVFFHYSFVFLLFFYLFYKVYIFNKYWSFFLLSLLFIVFLNLSNVLILISNYLPFVRASSYIDKVQEGNSGFKLFLLNIAFLFFYFLVKKLNSIKESFETRVSECLLIFLLFFNILIQFLNIPLEGPGRVIYYFYIFYLFLFDFLYKNTKNEQRYLMGFLLVIFSITYMCVLFSIGNIHDIFPYESCDYNCWIK